MIEETKDNNPKLTFSGIHKSYTKYGSYTIKQREVPMDEPIYVGFAVSQWSRLIMYETQCDKFQKYSGEQRILSRYYQRPIKSQ